MSFIEVTHTDYELLPEGRHQATVAEVDEDIERNTKYGLKKAVRLYFETNKTGRDGKRLRAIATANRSIGKLSRLAKYIKQITGKDPGQRFDPQSLVGSQVEIVIEYSERDGHTYANVVHISKRGSVPAATPPVNVSLVEIADEDVHFPGDDAVSA